MQIDSLDHLVLTVGDVQRTCDFYALVMGMGVVTFRGDRRALQFGQQKINLHQQGKEFEPKARSPLPGSADLCFLTSTPIATSQGCARTTLRDMSSMASKMDGHVAISDSYFPVLRTSSRIGWFPTRPPRRRAPPS